jgi:hypothetical protein
MATFNPNGLGVNSAQASAIAIVVDEYLRQFPQGAQLPPGLALQVLALALDGITPVWVNAPPATLVDGTVTNAKLANQVTKTVLGRTSAGTGVPENIAVATTLKTDLALVKGDVGLSNVDNTADASKPISAAQAAGLVPVARTVNGLGLSANIVLAKGDIGLGSVDNTADASKPVSTAQATAIAAKSDPVQLITYSGTGRSLANSDNGNIIRCTNSGAVSMTVPSGLVSGFNCSIVQGSSGIVTAIAGSGVTLTPTPALLTSGVETDLAIIPAAANLYTVYSPTGAGASTLAAMTDMGTYDLATNNPSVAAVKALATAAMPSTSVPEAAQDAVAAMFAAGAHSGISFAYNDAANSMSATASGGGASALAVITGTRGTGNILTATPVAGWNVTYQWQSLIGSTWTNISGQTASSTVELLADKNRDIRCVITPTTYNTNVLLQPAPVFTAQSAPAGVVGTAYTYTFAATGAVSFALGSGSLPAGLSLNTATGVLSGTPTTAATSVFVITATNSGGTTNSTSQSVVVTSGASTLLDELWAGSAGAAPPSGWFLVGSGSNPTVDGAGHLVFDAVSSNFRIELKNVSGGTARVWTWKIKPDAFYPAVFMMSQSDASNYIMIMVHDSIGKLRALEHHGGTDDNIQDGVTGITDNLTVEYEIRATLSGGVISIDLRNVTTSGAFIPQMTITPANNTGGTYVGVGNQLSSSALFGEVKVTS